MPLDLFIISVYCWVADFFTPLSPRSIRTRGFAPKLSDAEVITMEVVGECLGMDQDTQIYAYFHRHFRSWFPHLGTRSTFARQAANLWACKKKLHQVLAGASPSLGIVDGFPMPVCEFKRAKHAHVFRGEASYGYCAAKDQTYYGFKGHLVINEQGKILDFGLTKANADEREALFDFLPQNPRYLLGDKGYLTNKQRRQELAYHGITLITPVRSNMKDPLPKEARSFFSKTRRRIETVIGQLTERFHLEKVRAKDLWHLAHRTIRKVLAHTFAFVINQHLGNPGLQFERLFRS